MALASGDCAAEQNGASCVYNGRPYSEGALICIQRSLMQSCSSDGARAVWKTVVDTTLGHQCLGPGATAYAPQRHVQRRYAARYQSGPRIGSGGRCFDFAGKVYCE